MATFSFGKFFGKHPRQPRFRPDLSAGGLEARNGGETLPVGRLVSFTDDGPEDAPLFQELEAAAGSPFVVVGGMRPSAGSGGLPGPSRTASEEGFTADELTAMVPARWARPGAVPGTQVIPLPHQVLRASLAAGQPAVLLSQLHQACPELFMAPTSLDDDLVIALPPQKVQRLVARVEPGPIPGSVGVIPPPRLARDVMEPLAWTAPVGLTDQDEAGGQAFAAAISKVKLPPPRRKFDDMHGGDLRPLMECPAPPAPNIAFMDLAVPTPGLPADDLAAGLPSPFLTSESAYRPGAGSPFQVASALPHGLPDRGGRLPKRFDSPFAIVSPGEVPAVLESPFARHPIAGVDVPPAEEPPILEPEPPATVSLALTALLQGQTAEGLGFAPERVPASVRVTLATAPLLSQVATGRIRVSLAEVVDGLDAKFQPAFKQARSGLELVVPMRELFDNLPEATLPTPVAPPIATTFATPFSIRAEEDHPLTAVNSPFQIASPMPASGPEVLPPPLAVAPPPIPVVATVPFLPPPPIIEAAPSFELPPVVARVESPFVVVPESAESVVPVGLSDAAIAPPPFLMVPEDSSASEPAATRWTSSPPTSAPFVLAPMSEALLSPEEPPAAPAAAPEPAPLRNPFTLAPGEGLRGSLGLELSYLPYDEEPVPLESLRESEPDEHLQHVALNQPKLLPELPAVLWPSTAFPVPVPPPLPPIPEVSAAPAPPSPVLPPPVYRWALSEQEPLPPPSAVTEIQPAAPFVELPAAPESFLPSAPLQTAWSAFPSIETPPVLEHPEEPSSVPFIEKQPDAPAPLPPTADDRAAFAFVFAPSALSAPSDDGRTPLGAMDSMPAIALAKLPPLSEEPVAPPPTPPFLVPPSAPREIPQPVTWSTTAIQETPPLSTTPAVGLEPPTSPEPPSAWMAPPQPAADPATIEDLSFGYVDNPTQLALRAVFATGKTLGTQEVVDLAARLDGLRACLVHTPHATLQSAAAPDDTDEVRHFRERAASLFEKTASLVRELDPTAREQSFTLRTGKGVVSFFAIDDVCLAVLHGEPSFRPGVREKLTLVVRSVADMLAA